MASLLGSIDKAINLMAEFGMSILSGRLDSIVSLLGRTDTTVNLLGEFGEGFTEGRWILKSGKWDDGGKWMDSKKWNDGT